MLAPNPIFNAPDEMGELFAPACVDIFAGCGGWSTGAEQAFADAGWRDRRIDLMINHCADAVGVHMLNHPLTIHMRSNVLEVDPCEVLPGRRIGYVHLSPDCTDHSKAKGGVPRRKEIRALADVGIVWARMRRPDVITLENVEEWKQWGPLLPNGKPDPKKRGQEFRRWVSELEALGYVLEVRELRACDIGVPTTRKRLFVIARCDGKKIIWPGKTHGSGSDQRVRNGDCPIGSGSRNDRASGRRPACANSEDQKRCASEKAVRGSRRGLFAQQQNGGLSNAAAAVRLKPYEACGDQLEWHRPMLSIFATPAEAVAYRKHFKLKGTPQRPLKPKTMSRIAGGAFKYVLETPRPYTINIENYGWNSIAARGVDEPLSTVTAGPKGGKHALVNVALAGYSVPRYGEAEGQAPRCQSIHDPAATIVGKGNGTNLIAAVLSRFNTQKDNESRCQTPDDPVSTVDTQNRFALVAGSLMKYRGSSTGTGLDGPCPTITSGAGAARPAGHAHGLGVMVAHLQTLNHGGPEHRATSLDAPLPTVCSANDARGLIGAAFVNKHYTGVIGSPADAPLSTVTAVDHNSLSVAYLSHFYTSNTNGGQGDPRRPAKTITSGGQHSCVAATTTAPYMLAYYGQGSGTTGHTPAEPMPTVVSKARFALVTATGGYWPLTGLELERAKKVARFLIRELGEKKIARHLVWIRDPAARKTFPLVRVMIDGEPRLMTDLLLRMLYPRELANCQGFPSNYIIDRRADGKVLSTAAQVKLIGNAVPPAFARAIVKANVVDQGVLGPPPRAKRRRRREAVLS